MLSLFRSAQIPSSYTAGFDVAAKALTGNPRSTLLRSQAHVIMLLARVRCRSQVLEAELCHSLGLQQVPLVSEHAQKWFLLRQTRWRGKVARAELRRRRAEARESGKLLQDKQALEGRLKEVQTVLENVQNQRNDLKQQFRVGGTLLPVCA